MNGSANSLGGCSNQISFIENCLIMAIAPTATDMPQNELYENNNLEAARV
jgi:hypothetical protein